MQTDSQIWTIYFDTCCLSRLFDVQTHPRVRQESEAISRILDHIRAGSWYWISSHALEEEVEQNPNLGHRFQIKDRLTDVNETVSVGMPEISRGKQLEVLGFKELDALHIACAESGDANIFLTTDDRLLRTAKRNSSNLYVQVENPYVWFQRRGENEHIGNDR
ncbi:MAG: PIN domain-containing protein [Candidatus Poribacteria bacterium]|nr:PIN domain-containing protein [Candidatus Poribacteria bacterium]